MLKVGGAFEDPKMRRHVEEARAGKAKFLPIATAYRIEPSTSQLELSRLRLQADFPRAKV